MLVLLNPHTQKEVFRLATSVIKIYQ